MFGAISVEPRTAPLSPHLPPRRRRMHAPPAAPSFLHPPPSGSSPSSSPMRSSFQVQQSSINLIHSPTPSSGREPAASGRQITGVRPPPQPARRSCCCALVLSLRCPPSPLLLIDTHSLSLSFSHTHSFFLQHVSAALHSRELLTNEAAEPGRGRHGPANQRHCPVNECWC